MDLHCCLLLPLFSRGQDALSRRRDFLRILLTLILQCGNIIEWRVVHQNHTPRQEAEKFVLFVQFNVRDEANQGKTRNSIQNNKISVVHDFENDQQALFLLLVVYFSCFPRRYLCLS